MDDKFTAAIAAYRAGDMTLRAAAQLAGVSTRTLAAKAGPSPRPPGTRPAIADPQQVTARYRAGEGVTELAADLGVSRSAIAYALGLTSTARTTARTHQPRQLTTRELERLRKLVDATPELAPGKLAASSERNTLARYIRDLHADGVALTIVADALGRTPTTPRSWIRAAGLDLVQRSVTWRMR